MSQAVWAGGIWHFLWLRPLLLPVEGALSNVDTVLVGQRITEAGWMQDCEKYTVLGYIR